MERVFSPTRRKICVCRGTERGAIYTQGPSVELLFLQVKLGVGLHHRCHRQWIGTTNNVFQSSGLLNRLVPDCYATGMCYCVEDVRQQKLEMMWKDRRSDDVHKIANRHD